MPAKIIEVNWVVTATKHGRPCQWRAELGPLNIILVHWPRGSHYPERFEVTCDALGITGHELTATIPSLAMLQAFFLVREKIGVLASQVGLL